MLRKFNKRCKKFLKKQCVRTLLMGIISTKSLGVFNENFSLFRVKVDKSQISQFASRIWVNARNKSIYYNLIRSVLNLWKYQEGARDHIPQRACPRSTATAPAMPHSYRASIQPFCKALTCVWPSSKAPWQNIINFGDLTP